MGDRLRDRVALVIGAGSIGPGWGNGKAAAVLFAREGAKVFAVDIDEAAAAETCGIIRGEGGTATPWTADASRSDQVQALVEACIDEYGRIDVLQNNVGIVSVGGPVELEEAEWDRVLDINLKSFYLACKYVLPYMERQGAGAIVNISSVTSIRWLGIPYLTYSATKGAINQLTQSVALEYAKRGIRCNAVLPGLMATPMTRVGLPGAYSDGDVEQMDAIRAAQCPTGTMGDAWDVAHASLFLASDEARYITGHLLVVDGGLTCKVS